MRRVIFDFTEIQNENNSLDELKKVEVKPKDSKEEMFDYINSVMENEDYGLGIHQTQGESVDNTLSKIMERGLEIEPNKKILSTVSSFGIHNKIDKDYLKQAIIDYSYGKEGETKRSIVVLVPPIISSSRGEKVFLGFPPYDIECHGNDYRTSCVLDSICMAENEKGSIPKEFILGYFSNNNGEILFSKNPNYYKFLSQEEKDEFFEKMQGKIQGKYRRISDAVILDDIETLEELRMEEQSKIAGDIREGTRNNVLNRGVNRQLAENLSRSAVQIKQDDSATQALAYVERSRAKNEPEIMNRRNKKRVLLEIYRDTGIGVSELTRAKGILREGAIEQEKNDEGINRY